VLHFRIELAIKKYTPIISMVMHRRNQNLDVIETLDSEELKIAKEIAVVLSEGVKVRYYSEGLLKFIT
jgi:hypothetical protein